MIDWTGPQAAKPNAHHNKDHGAGQHTDVARELFVYPKPSSVDETLYGNYSVVQTMAGTGTAALFTLKVPDDFVSLTHVHVVVMEEGGESTVVWNFDTSYAANGEAKNTHTGNSAGNQTVLTVDEITELADQSSLFSSLAAGDYVGVLWLRDGADVNDTAGDVHCLGMLVEYIGEQ